MADSELVQKVKLRKVSSLVCKENKGCNTTVYAKEKNTEQQYICFKIIIGDKFKKFNLKSLINLTKMTATLLFIMG